MTNNKTNISAPIVTLKLSKQRVHTLRKTLCMFIDQTTDCIADYAGIEEHKEATIEMLQEIQDCNSILHDLLKQLTK